IGSGWRIYNASPIFDFRFPETFTLGGDVEDALALHNDPGVASAIAWHFAAATFRLQHRLGEYNVVQRVAYWGALGAVAMMLLSGIAIWKPVQTYPLEVLFGGFQGARIVHFVFMTAIVLFIVIHVALVILVPKTFVA